MSSSLNYSQFIWNVADVLRGTYKQHQYGDVILPFTVLYRLDAVLEPTKEAVLAAISGYDADDEVPLAMLRARAGHAYSFYNASQHTLNSLKGDADTLEQNLRSYVNAFSPNVRDIFEKYKFEDTVAELAEHDLLFQVVQHFSKVNLHPDNVSNQQMGNIFEELIRKFAEASNETAGEHFTPREVIELMVTLLLADEEDLLRPNISRDVYDPTAGTGGMLSVADEHIKQYNPSAQVNLLGQEINPASYAICKADMVVKGQAIENIALGNTLTNPAFEERTFHYGLSNPPFGVDWKGAKAVVEKEHKVAGFNGRFGAGLPRVSDGSLLFLQHLISKLREPSSGAQQGVAETGGRGAIVLNGSPLFTGGAGSGESNIRKWVLDNDYLEAIIGLPTDMFYNTGISTYVWMLNKSKKAERRNKVQLIDATEMFEKMRKSVGSKRKQLSSDHIAEIARLFKGFESADDKRSKVFDREEFMYRTITVERPLRINFAFLPERIERLMGSKELAKLKLDDDAAATLRAALDGRAVEVAGVVETDRLEFEKQLKAVFDSAGVVVKPVALKKLVDELSERDETAEPVVKAGKPVADAALRDSENVPWGEDIHEYLEREVKPFVPDAWIDESKTKEGAEIPFTRHFYEYVPPRSLEEIDRDLNEVLGRIRERLEGLGI
ncbi:MAG: class I SAM-dependent DNA methyltransferase [Rothia sp. (in: high G+C Gram-positive bacteria)]|nr:class I SAM-dependent DNA methyltransferase [Rothia sp. (in: high G+C Gram-positive bacteria)]